MKMAATLKRRQKHESIKLRYGSLYTVIELMTARRLIRFEETSRGGKRLSARLRLTASGRICSGTGCGICWRNRQRSFRSSGPAGVFCPCCRDEAVALLCDRRAAGGKTHADAAELQDILGKTFAEVASRRRIAGAAIRPEISRQSSSSKNEYRLTTVKAELDFVTELVRRITEQAGPSSLWRDSKPVRARLPARE